jgi:alkylated DNA repair dioxygenase AlkB
MDQIPGLKILKGALPIKCKRDKPCILRDEESEEIPCCYCCIKGIDKDKWIHNDHICTSSECTPDTVLGLDETKNGLARRTQHYGYIYNYKSTRLVETRPLDSNKVVAVLADLLSPNYEDGKVEQCIINEYTPGQSISAHTDNFIFGSPIMTITLSSICTMVMSQTGEEEIPITLEAGDIVLLRGEARKNWRHSIKRIGNRNPRRISVTFRNIARATPKEM